jgi:hypothetical protein
MIYEFRLPKINAHMTGATIECLFAQPGDGLKLGTKFLDFSVDLGSAFAQECPPISFFRLVLREPAYLRTLTVAPGQYCLIDDLLATLSTDPTEALGSSATRGVRVTVAGILHHNGMWTGNRP